jgi:hypothetical protein
MPSATAFPLPCSFIRARTVDRTKDSHAAGRELAPEKRGDIRYAIGESGVLWRDGHRADCTVINISATGALVETSSAPPEGAKVELRIANWGQFPAEVLHHRQNRLGLRFINPNPCKCGPAGG